MSSLSLPSPRLLGLVLAEEAFFEIEAGEIRPVDVHKKFAERLILLAERLVNSGASKREVADWLETLAAAYRSNLDGLDSHATFKPESPCGEFGERSVVMVPALIVVGADKGGVGKTTFSRALLDYCASRKTPVRAFDTEYPRGTLARFHPDITDVVDLTRTADQIRMIDTIETTGAKVTVIDARSGQLESTLRALKNIGFIEAAKQGRFTLCLFHVLGATVSSLEEISIAAPYLSNGHYFVVKNRINDSSFFEGDPEAYREYLAEVQPAGEISIPKLDELAYEQVELAGASFADFIDNRTDNGRGSHSFVLRGYVRTWMRQIEQELDRVRLIDIVAGRKPLHKQERSGIRAKAGEGTRIKDDLEADTASSPAIGSRGSRNEGGRRLGSRRRASSKAFGGLKRP